MTRFAILLVLLVWLISAFGGEDQGPAKGKLLVATELVQGSVFAETVILLTHYDENGAMGIVVNRPTEVETEEILGDIDAFPAYSGRLFWGGPVQTNSLRALLRSDSPPRGAEEIVTSVHQVTFDDELKDTPMDLESLRFFLGYAGWAAGQLDSELARGSWHVVPASDELVFAPEPHLLWKRLTPPIEHRAAAQQIGRMPATVGLEVDGLRPISR